MDDINKSTNYYNHQPGLGFDTNTSYNNNMPMPVQPATAVAGNQMAYYPNQMNNQMNYPMPPPPQTPVLPQQPTINININAGAGFGFPNGQTGIRIVPNPVPKDQGLENNKLIMANSLKNEPTGPIAFGSLGSFTYKQPKLMPGPPRNLPPPPEPMRCKKIPNNAAQISQEEAKELLIKWAKSSCCRAGKPAKEAHVTGFFSANALMYTLETFTEKRSLVCNYSACRPGETIDPIVVDNSGSMMVNPWMLPCAPDTPFKDHEKRLNLPKTDILQPCFRCQAFGKLKCEGCSGKGNLKCTSCNGVGTVSLPNQSQSACSGCQGRKFVDCPRCTSGAKSCDVCNGTQLLKWYLQVIVQFKNHVDQYINERTKMPDNLVKSGTGEILCQGEGAQLSPIQDCESNDLNQNSLRLIEKAVHSYAAEKQLLQRHVLKCISVTECDCTYETKQFKFWIVGQDRNVECPDYPGGCCCCCTIA